ncbi:MULTISPECIES: peptidoglycan-associated lipoprotein Pal [Desulfococcus]|jgi:peptidoglycan-associated lipoprotein|uniref:Peptidoglycan-associated lipoprotein n=1 Tax=Desulfococcus multivorans DSM 2059 TaxID=1121405 RepID=S7TTC6_DESML|nr:peptidoglycan-associated lipoprotein Pal [Desulfococcus multivorans]AOY59484.1 Pal: peptidoglycan-associated lipoprotein [Desulfococcus multivorans]AQV01684.1 peptidoglycan-associated lipoprotein [Desulfococcus multivorans]EPR40005.1 peptidoglycan-associated lipoprotein [Desulfococcus multivorans DSM 2059]MDX9817410.1 peptidoglycan-associated lipoprotein Pal [Desulfococcus multivorans]SKA01521.1 peptidoglycan-associated lipoprotein [Desulfococcus multivorans DSM 2059]
MRGKWWIILAVFLVIPGLLTTTSCSKKMVKSDGMTMAGEGAVSDEASAGDTGYAQGGLDQGGLDEEGLTPEQRRAKEQFLNEHIYFEFDSDILSGEAQSILMKKAEYLQDNPNRSVTIEGHCDERGTTEYNLALGDRRAQSVKRYLETLGVAASRMTPVSYGEESPADPGHDEEAWAKNRRAQFVFN